MRRSLGAPSEFEPPSGTWRPAVRAGLSGSRDRRPSASRPSPRRGDGRGDAARRRPGLLRGEADGSGPRRDRRRGPGDRARVLAQVADAGRRRRAGARRPAGAQRREPTRVARTAALPASVQSRAHTTEPESPNPRRRSRNRSVVQDVPPPTMAAPPATRPAPALPNRARRARSVTGAIAMLSIVGVACLPSGARGTGPASPGPTATAATLAAPTPTLTPSGPTPRPSFVRPTQTPAADIPRLHRVRPATPEHDRQEVWHDGPEHRVLEPARLPDPRPGRRRLPAQRVRVGWTLVLVPNRISTEQTLPQPSPSILPPSASPSG